MSSGHKPTNLLFRSGGCIRIGSGNGMSSPFIHSGSDLVVGPLSTLETRGELSSSRQSRTPD